MGGSDLKTRVLKEIDQGLEIYGAAALMEVRILRALKREVERHKKSTYGDWCSFCGAVDATLAWVWPCPTITDTARELGVE